MRRIEDSWDNTKQKLTLSVILKGFSEGNARLGREMNACKIRRYSHDVIFSLHSDNRARLSS